MHPTETMRIVISGTIALGVGLFGVSALQGQAKPDPDVLLFTDGERLTGHFVKSTGPSLTFKSDALGEITVDWSKVKELQSSVKVAVIPKGVKLRGASDHTRIRRATLSGQKQQVPLAAETPASNAAPIPVADTGQIVDQAGFQKALDHQPG